MFCPDWMWHKGQVVLYTLLYANVHDKNIHCEHETQYLTVDTDCSFISLVIMFFFFRNDYERAITLYP